MELENISMTHTYNILNPEGNLGKTMPLGSLPEGRYSVMLLNSNGSEVIDNVNPVKVQELVERFYNFHKCFPNAIFYKEYVQAKINECDANHYMRI